MTWTRAALFALVAGFLGVTPVAAQEDVNGQFWIDYHSHYYRSEKIEWYADVGLRTLTRSRDWSQIYVRPSLRFHRYKAMDLHAGVGLFYTNNLGLDNILELRPWQGAKFRWPNFDSISFSHYFRLEQRLTFTPESNDAAMRGRYKLGTRLPIRKALHHEAFDTVYIPLSIEVFTDFGQRVDTFFGSRGRLDAGLGYIANDSWLFELHLIAQASRSGATDDFETTEYIVRLQIKHLFSSKDYRKQQQDLPE